jgi:hypothetical protein
MDVKTISIYGLISRTEISPRQEKEIKKRDLKGRRCGLTIHTEYSATDTEDTGIEAKRFLTFCSKSKYLGSDFVPELSDTADINENGAARRESYSVPRGRNR